MKNMKEKVVGQLVANLSCKIGDYMKAVAEESNPGCFLGIFDEPEMPEALLSYKIKEVN